MPCQEGVLRAVLELSLNVRIIVQTLVSQTCLEKQNLFLKKRLLPCPVCHCESWIFLTAESKRYYRKMWRLFCPHPSCQKIPLSLIRRAAPCCSGGCKHFKIQLCAKINAWRYLDINISSWPPCPQLVFTPFWLVVSLTGCDQCPCLVSLRVSDERRAHTWSSGLPQDRRRNHCHWESCCAPRRVRMREK